MEGQITIMVHGQTRTVRRRAIRATCHHCGQKQIVRCSWADHSLIAPCAANSGALARTG